MSIFMDSEKAPTVQVGAFADIYFAGGCHSIRPLSFMGYGTGCQRFFRYQCGMERNHIECLFQLSVGRTEL